MTDEMKLIDVTGEAHPISKYNTGWMMGAGWIFFSASFISNYIFYMIHPSATDVSVDAINKRLRTCLYFWRKESQGNINIDC